MDMTFKLDEFPSHIQEIRDHAYSIAKTGTGDAAAYANMLLPFIDMLAVLAAQREQGSASTYEVAAVEVSELSCKTGTEGWEYVETVFADVPVYVARQFVVGNPPFLSSGSEQVVTRYPRCLIRRRRDSPVAALIKSLADERRNLDKAARRVTELEKVLAQAEKEHAALLAQRDAEVRRAMEQRAADAEKVAAVEKNEAAARASMQVLEAQLAKLTHALGALKMKEILG